MKTGTVWARREGNGSDGRKLDQDLCVRFTIYHMLFFLLSMGATAVYVLLLNVLVVHMFMFVYITYYLPL